ncbi:hypothetical protein [Chryseobacterium indologenes]|uniref:DUF3558 domain-containing protein n=1 Tax=Chryseobacterium indologenes TaxID=253 RepID=A0A0N0ZWK5_CHRID|nr:hypothetical protein [Chryseobacterium indologenes]KPE51010.1 hypothetical protein AOB46_12550 [Chryseobacterium indologenes]
MKKLIFIGAMALTMLAACQNENNEVFSTEKTETQKTASKTVIDDAAVLNSVKPLLEANQLARGKAEIMCHTDYLADSGSACVYNEGYMFQVTWGVEWVYQPSTGQYIDQVVWHSNSVHSCGC